MRADRLVATLLLLQSRGRVTAGELAAELEVSVATARRDLEALSTAGVPVYPQPGRGGGWSLVGGYRTDLTGLTAAESQALFLLAGPGGSLTPEVRSALRKLVRALPSTFRADAEAAAGAVLVDSAGWGDPARKRPAVVDLLQDAVVHRRQVRLDYTSRTGESRHWVVDPLGLVDKDDLWYLLATTDSGQRTFRVDRIVTAHPTQLVSERPADFDLAAAWSQVVDEVEQQRSLLSATVLVDATLVHVLRAQFGRHCHVSEAAEDGRTTVRVAAPTPLTIAQQLAGWGTALDVVEPESVRAELARLGAELSGRYGP
jgi:predicted DNA-binding transcriptional regulator YafY